MEQIDYQYYAAGNTWTARFLHDRWYNMIFNEGNTLDDEYCKRIISFSFSDKIHNRFECLLMLLVSPAVLQWVFF